LPLQFESFGVWVRGDQDNGTFLRSTEQAHGGSASGKLSYDFGTSDNDFVVFLQNNSISGNPNTIQAWVYGDGSGHFLNAWISDSGNETWQVPLGQVFHTGWSQMTGYIDTEQEWPWTHISGPNNDKVDYPISFRGLVLDDFNSAYTGQGTIYIDDLTTTTSNIPGSFNTPGAPTATPGGTGGNPTATLAAATAVPNTGTLGRILYTSGNILLTTDPTWSSPQEVGTAAVNSCNSTASTVTGQTINLYFGNFCGIGENGTGVCASPNSSYEVVTNALGDGQHSISVRPAGSENFIFVYQGTVDRGEGIRWSPLSDSFLFVVGDTVHRSTLDGSYNQIIPTAFTPIISANGSYILYRKPIGPGINDIFVANIDGSNQTNVTNVSSIDKRCAAWVR
jgi:hypothetical protein